MKSLTDIRVDQLRQELLSSKLELSTVKEQLKKEKDRVREIQYGLVEFVDNIVNYLGKSHRVSKKLLQEVEELRTNP